MGSHWISFQKTPKIGKELELTGLLVNIHGFMQLLCNRYFKVLVDHKVIEYRIKSKTESQMMRLKTLLLKLSEYVVPHFGICPILKWCCTILEFQNVVPILKRCCTILEHLVLPHFKMVLPYFGTFIFSI